MYLALYSYKLPFFQVKKVLLVIICKLQFLSLNYTVFNKSHIVGQFYRSLCIKNSWESFENRYLSMFEIPRKPRWQRHTYTVEYTFSRIRSMYSEKRTRNTFPKLSSDTVIQLVFETVFSKNICLSINITNNYMFIIWHVKKCRELWYVHSILISALNG